MSRIISAYKNKPKQKSGSDKNSSNTYSTFANDDLYNAASEENLSFEFVKKPQQIRQHTEAKICKSVKTPKKKSRIIKNTKRWKKNKSLRKINDWFRKRCAFCCCTCKKTKKRNVTKDNEIDAAFAAALSLGTPTQREDDACSVITLPMTPSRETTLRRVEECKWKDAPKNASNTSAKGSFLGEVLGAKDRFLERLEYDRSIPRKKKLPGKAVPDIAVSLVADDSSISANSSPLVRLRSGQHGGSGGSVHEWGNSNSGQDEDVDRLMRLHSNRSLSSLGLRSDSMASVYSGAGDGRYGTVTVKGEVEFGLQYNYKTNALMIRIRQCRDLAQVDAKRSRSDPYVKVYLLPDKSKSGKRKTKVKKHTVNPVFEETLSFNLTLDELKTRTLWLTVWHSDMFGRNDFLGEVMMPLEDKVFDDPTPVWYQLQERTEPFEESSSHKGDIILALKFIPPDMSSSRKSKKSRGALHVLVKEAKNLVAAKANGTSDPFCKSYLLPDKGRSSKQKTPVLRRCLNPAWNYTFVYDDITLQDLTERALELTVWDHDRLGSNEFLGMVRLSMGTGKYQAKSVDWMDAYDKEISLWQSMLNRPNFWVESCISLRTSTGNKT